MQEAQVQLMSTAPAPTTAADGAVGAAHVTAGMIRKLSTPISFPLALGAAVPRRRITVVADVDPMVNSLVSHVLIAVVVNVEPTCVKFAPPLVET